MVFVNRLQHGIQYENNEINMVKNNDVERTNDWLENKQRERRHCLALATCVYRFGMHGVRSAKGIKGAVDIGSVSATENEDKYEEMDVIQVTAMSEVSWQKLIDSQVFSDPMTADDNDRLRKLVSKEMTGRYAFLLIATKVDWQSVNHHVGQGVWTGFCVKAEKIMLTRDRRSKLRGRRTRQL